MKHGRTETTLLSICQLQGVLLDQFNLGVLILDRSRRIVSANRLARELVSDGRVLYLNTQTLHARSLISLQPREATSRSSAPSARTRRAT